MRGSKSGVIVRLKKDFGFSSLVNIGGCSLHHDHNVARHACHSAKLGEVVENFVRNIYYHITDCGGEDEKLSEICSDFGEIKKLAFLRLTDTRWIQILPVVERVLSMYQPLIRYFTETRPTGASVSDIKMPLTMKNAVLLVFFSRSIETTQRF